MPKRALINKGADIILLGDPASGKATQAERLMKKYNLIDFDMGKELRKLQRTGTAQQKRALSQTYTKGKLSPTQIVRSILKKKIFKTPKSKNILFDGHPKMVSEARLLRTWRRQAGRGDKKIICLYLSVPKAESVKRMQGRVEYFRGKFSKRTDDNISALRNRFKYYRINIKEVLRFFKSIYPYRRINGLGTEEEVHKRMVKAINELVD